jgi:ribosomal-protein-alanine N-acetyltransferase
MGGRGTSARCGQTCSVERAVIVRTDRLAVTTWLPDDLDDLNRLHSDPVTMAFIGGRAECMDESSARLARYLHEQATRGWTKWRVADQGGRMIGRAGFGGYAGDRELGYMFDRSLWGHGLATEVAIALIRWHTRNPASRPDIDEPMRLWAYAAVDHTASVRVMTKAGLRFVETREHDGRPYAFFVQDDDADPER